MGDVWFHFEEQIFAVKLESSCFYISFHGYLTKYLFSRTVRVLEEQFFERTGKLLFQGITQKPAYME